MANGVDSRSQQVKPALPVTGIACLVRTYSTRAIENLCYYIKNGISFSPLLNFSFIRQCELWQLLHRSFSLRADVPFVTVYWQLQP
ncbi:MAG: hypothetical protein KME17_08640 [Cyanosarcina radialis HA8281-LM2]|nr:hypothetical protein [Cyanosarcina radialis HA8281-LM2]